MIIQTLAEKKGKHEILKQNISTLEQKRRWLLCGGATIISIVAIILGVLLTKSNTPSGKFSRLSYTFVNISYSG